MPSPTLNGLLVLQGQQSHHQTGRLQCPCKFLPLLQMQLFNGRSSIPSHLPQEFLLRSESYRSSSAQARQSNFGRRELLVHATVLAVASLEEYFESFCPEWPRSWWLSRRQDLSLCNCAYTIASLGTIPIALRYIILCQCYI